MDFFRSHKLFWVVDDKMFNSVNLTTWCFCMPAKHHCILLNTVLVTFLWEEDVLFLLSPTGPFKATTNLRLFNLSILLNNHNCFCIWPLLNSQRTISVSSSSTSTSSPPIDSWLLNYVSVTSEQNDRQSTNVLEEIFKNSNINLWSQIWLFFLV